MRILAIADPRVPVPPKDYGGTERIAGWVCGGLAARGHVVDLMASAGSTPLNGDLLTYRETGSLKLHRGWSKAIFFARSLRAARRVDAVIAFGRVDYLYPILKHDVPLVIRFGNPLTQTALNSIFQHRQRRMAIVGISENQISGLQPRDRISVIYNGIDVNKYAAPLPNKNTRSKIAFLGRLTKSKGVDLAIEAAKRAGRELVIAGPRPSLPEDRHFFESKIAPQLDERIQWVGVVNDDKKRQLLSTSEALLFPLQGPEAFGIVMAEALACGCPVIGWNRGPVPEIVEDGKTGLVVNSLESMVDAINRVSQIRSEDCVASAKRRFSQERMIDQYLQTIESTVAGL